MAFDSSSLRSLGQELARVLRFGEAMQVCVHESAVVSCDDAGRVCVALASSENSLSLAKGLLRRQLEQPQRYGAFQVGLNAGDRVCLLWRSCPEQRTDAQTVLESLSSMLELTKGRDVRR
ncbi:hypothetical protein J2W35_004169 [Variovorax boronicumulans]|nr:hypothetical protein [Variovorax boronicumulans]